MPLKSPGQPLSDLQPTTMQTKHWIVMSFVASALLIDVLFVINNSGLLDTEQMRNLSHGLACRNEEHVMAQVVEKQVNHKRNISRLIIRSRKIPKLRDRVMKQSVGFEVWQALRQQCCWCACQISERPTSSKHKSRGFETSQILR